MSEISNKFFNSHKLKLFSYRILPKSLIEPDEKLDIYGFCEDIHDDDKLFDFIHTIYEVFDTKPTFWLHVMDKDELIARCLIFERQVLYKGIVSLKMGGIGSLVVKSEYRRMGIGRELMKEAEKQIISDTCDFCFLHPETKSLTHYYKSMDYSELHIPYTYIGRSGNLYSNQGMIKYIQHSPRLEELINGDEPLHIGNYDF